MRHQARILGDGFDCSCGYSARLRRVDATRENIKAEIDRHMEEAERQEQARPDRATLTKLVEDFQAFRKHVDDVTMMRPGESAMMKEEPPVPAELLERIRVAVSAFAPADFPVLREFVRDPGGPQFRDVETELGKLRRHSR